jgi:hypothetical protein
VNDKRSEPVIPDWQLERFRLDELPAEERADVERALDVDPRLRERLAELERSDKDIAAQHPPRVVGAAIRARTLRERPAPSRPLVWAGAFAVAVMGLALLRPWSGQAPLEDDEIRVKGLATRLLVFRQGAAAPEALENGATVRARDVVQVAYQVTDKRYGVILSVDGRGVITRHLPKAGAHAVELTTGTPVPLPEAYELDDAPEYERFHLVASARPFALDVVLPAARRLRGDRLDLPASFEQQTILLRKEAAR